MPTKKRVGVQNLIATQANSLIEATYPRAIKNKDGVIVELDQKISTRAHKVSRLIVSLIKPDDDDLRFYKIDIATLKNYLGYKPDFNNGAFYQDLKEIANRLNKQPIEIRPEKSRVIVAYFISSYELNTKTGQIEFEISAKLKPFLLQLKNNFTSVHLANIPKLSSGYSIRLYEILLQYKSIGKRHFDDIAKLQAMLGSNHEQYGHFKARVLDPSKKDMAKNTNIMFEYDEIKTGKKITGLVFHIKENVVAAEPEEKQLKISFSADVKRHSDGDVNSVLQGFGIAHQKIVEYVNLGFEIIKDEIRRASASKRCGDIETYYKEKISLLQTKQDMENPAGFLVKALQEDWLTPKAVKEKATQAIKKDKLDKQSQIRLLEKQIEDLEKQCTETEKPIFENLVNDETIFAKAYAKFLEENDGYLLRSVINQYKTPLEVYYNSSMASSIIRKKIYHFVPAHFTEVVAIKTKIESMKIELKLIKR